LSSAGAAKHALERRLLQSTVAIAGLVPVIAGGDGVFCGLRAFALTGDAFADGHLRYLSGLLLGIGFAFWISIPDIERHRARFLLLAAIVFLGGCARLLSALSIGGVTFPGLFALIMELAVTPAICLWQRRIAKRYERQARA
jgi:hypothetical protein